jgi:HK97 family phage prohead protease
MDPQYLRAYRADDGQADTGPIRFVASTEVVARDGMVVEAAGWDLANYRRNPVVLWSHDYGGFNSPRPPIGRAKMVPEEKRLLADVTFDSEDEFAASLERKVRAGFLNAVSVGFNIMEIAPAQEGKAPRVTKAELLDVSLVPIPADPKALKERQARGLADLGATLAKLTDIDPDDADAPPEEVEWAGTALMMARLYLDPTEETDGTRRMVYERLARRYRRLGKEPPEFLGRADLAPLSEESVWGLFLEGEPELVAAPGFGRTRGGSISLRDVGDLHDAATLVQAVLARAQQPPEPTDDLTPDAIAAIRARLGA